MLYGQPQYFTGEEPYCPLEWTPPLSPNAPSDGPKARAFAEKAFMQETGEPLVLDDFQVKLIDSILERYPDNYHDPALAGRLRWRQAVVSIPRRNGKSTIAAVLILYSLCFSVAPNIGVFASTREQANIVFNSVKYNFVNNPALAARFKVTHGRGIESKKSSEPARFRVHAASGDGLQGQGFRGLVAVINDELHITKPEAYDAAVKGASTYPDAVVVGITTAGDENSELLKRLYTIGQTAIVGGEDANPRFGFWHWTTPDGTDLFDKQALLKANPAAHSKPARIDIDQEILEGKANPAGDYAEFRRYRRNEFVATSNPWISMDTFRKCGGTGIPKDYKGNIVVAIDRNQGWEWATFTAAAKIDNKVYTERIATIQWPDIEWIEQVCLQLAETHNIEMFVASATAMKDLIINLREQHGLPAEYITEQQLATATGIVSQLMETKRLIHDKNDPLTVRQLPKTVVKNSTEGVKVSIMHSPGRIDAIRSMILACYQAEKTEFTDFQIITL